MDRQFARSILIVIVQLMAFSSVCSAQSSEKLIEIVTVEGIGETESMAKREAFREAVRKVVGVLIDASTQVKNDEIIKEEILEYSGGFVQDYKITSKIEKDGFVRLKIECKVEKNRLRGKLISLKVAKEDIDGEKLSDKLMTQDEMRKNAASFLSKALEDRKGVFKAVLPIRLQDLPRQENGIIKVPVYIDFDNEKMTKWILRWRPIFEKLCSGKKTIIAQFDYNDDHKLARAKNEFFLENSVGVRNRREKIRLYVGESWSSNRDGWVAKYVVYDIPCDATKVSGLQFDMKDGKLSLADTTHAKIRLEVQGEGGVFIAGSETTRLGMYINNFFETPSPGETSGSPHSWELRLINSYNIGRNNEGTDVLILSPFVGDMWHWNNYYEFIPPKSFGTNFSISIPREKVSLIRSVSAELEWIDKNSKGILDN